MSNSSVTYDVLGVGNAIVDVLAQADDAFLADQDIPKGGMQLIDEDRAETLYGAMAPGVESSGGSAANTIAGLASFGGRGAFIGKVRNDQLGQVFSHDLRALNVHFATTAATDGPATARCLINVTPDAQRSMSTYLGACVNLGPLDIDTGLVAASAITYLEGYLFDPPEAKRAFAAAAEAATDSGRRTALTLSDSFCVERHRDDFKAFISDHVDILFANEDEAKSLSQTEDFDEAAKALGALADTVAITRSEKGAVILKAGAAPVRIDAIAPKRLLDTTGAGDQFAAGFLYGLAQDLPLATAGALGALAASEVISHYGARPETPLGQLAVENGLLPAAG